MFIWISSRETEKSKSPASICCEDLLQAMFDRLHIGRRDDPLPAEHAGMGHGAADILVIEAFVEIDGGGELLDEFVGRLGEAPPPEFVFGHCYAP